MYISKIGIKNFRLLENVDLSLEKRTTVIVGRNNSGKTSLTELFRRLLTDKTPNFRLEDFSLSAHEKFWQAYKQLQASEDENTVRATLPAIEISLSVDYEDNTASYGPLSEFIIDLNTDCTETLIKVRYELEKGKLQTLFEEIELNGKGQPQNKKQPSLKLSKTVFPNYMRPEFMRKTPTMRRTRKT